MQIRSKRLTAATGVCTLLIAAPALLAGPAMAAPAEMPTSSEQTSEHVIIPFSAPTTLDQAVTIGASSPEPVAGFRFDSGSIVGEYFLDSSEDPAAFLSGFEERYGTEPQVVGLVVERPRDSDAARSAIESAVPALIDTGLPAFTAPPIPAENVQELTVNMAAPTDAGLSARSSGNWAPESVYARTTRIGQHQYFSNDVTWINSSPTQIDARFGLEVGIDLYNGAQGTRGSPRPGDICGPDFRDQFIAKNYDWNNWSVFSPFGSLSNTRPYADLNDLFDSCGRNAMTVGFADPQNFPSDSGSYFIATMIDAQLGTKSTSSTGGALQLVDKVNCNIISGISLTDCMGTGGLESGNRPTLDPDRGWYANPNLCWTSDGSGTVPPVKVICP